MVVAKKIKINEYIYIYIYIYVFFIYFFMLLFDETLVLDELCNSILRKNETIFKEKKNFY